MTEAKASITTWLRLEPRSRDAEMSSSLQARVYDPLWLLARQWQLGEFQGEDNGSPVLARWRGEGAPLTRYHAGALAPNQHVDGERYDGRLPLEALVERELVRPPAGAPRKLDKLRLAAEAGQQFLRMLAQQPLSRDYRPAFVHRYPLLLVAEQRAELDDDSRAFLDVMAGRVPDGFLLRAAFASVPLQIAPELAVAAADAAEVEKAATQWRQWFDTLFSEPEGENRSWHPERLEYAFSVAAPLGAGEQVLSAQEYFEGHLDWHAFDLNPEISLGAAADQAFSEMTRTAIPAPASFPGMPAARFWEFEDARVDFGAVDAGPTDLARLLLVEFALAYGNDWFVIPVELDVGSLYRSRSLVVTDTFGVRSLIGPSVDPGGGHSLWRMFQLSHTPGSGIDRPAADLFLLPPSLIKTLESPPIEEVLLLRDEMANLVFGVERQVESASERPLNRYEASRKAPEAGHNASAMLRYRIGTELPDYWVPLMPVRVEAGLRLQRGAVLKTDGTPQILSARGRILQSGGELSLFEEEVPREGVRVTRSYQFTRWIDGTSHLWVGRRKNVGRGEGSSGLRFDAVTDES